MDHVLPTDVREILEGKPTELFTGAVVPLKEIPRHCRSALVPPMVRGLWGKIPFAASIVLPAMDRLVVEIHGRQFFLDIGEVIGAANAIVVKGARP